MTGRDIFKIWAPEKAKWTNWVRPVPFVEINENFEGYEVNNFTIPSINYIKKYSPNVAIFIDLPGDNSIKEGIAISKLGFRPIPIYNGTDEQEGAISTVDNKSIKIGLIKGALELKKIEISVNASPAFLFIILFDAFSKTLPIFPFIVLDISLNTVGISSYVNFILFSNMLSAFFISFNSLSKEIETCENSSRV